MRVSLAERSLELISHPLDLLRRRLLSILGPIAHPFIRSRALRVTTAAVIGFGFAAMLSIWIPLWQLALGPVIWGIPHILGDLRYLVIKQKLAHKISFWLLIVLPLAHFTYRPRVTTTMIALGGAALLGLIHHRRAVTQRNSSRSAFSRFILVTIFAVIGYITSRAWPYHAHFILLHAHNLITLGMWWFWRPRKSLWELAPIVVLLGCSALILCAWDAQAWRIAHASTDWAPAQLTLSYFERTLAWILPEHWRPQWVVLYGFLQSAHYLVWIRLIPEDDRVAETPITFRRSALKLGDDFGSWVMLTVFMGMVGLAAWAIIDISSARLTYLRWISAHASLEVAVIGYLIVSKQTHSHQGVQRDQRVR